MPVCETGTAPPVRRAVRRPDRRGSSLVDGTHRGRLMAASVLFSLPVVVFFLIVQRRLVSGMTAGAVKG